jgi:glycosyltransferase involved in cell wall biosynthesis
VKIAILGSRGIPVNYGGFETLAEELSTRLAKRSHEVTVYCCKPYSTIRDTTYREVRRVVIPTIENKVLEKPVFAFLSLIDSSLQKFDVILMLGVSVSFFCFIPRIFGKRVIINIDGLEWQRKKWGTVISSILKFEERVAGITADLVVTDSKWVRDYYKNEYGKNSVHIAYGSDIINYPPGETLEKYKLGKGQYILYVSRFEPENNPFLVRKAYDEIENPSKKLVMVGDAPFADAYIREVKDTKNPNIIFTGYLFGDGYKELLSNAYFYIQATEVGGIHPALLEAMGAGNCVLANDVPEHREVLKDAGFYYKGKEDLKEKVVFLLQNETVVQEKEKVAVRIIQEEYQWEKITDEYEKLFLNL